MKLSLSNIAWPAEYDDAMYAWMSAEGFSGLEIAPTRLFGETPYHCLSEARDFAQHIFEKYGLRVCSMQSLWYGRKERLFGGVSERAVLLDYTKQAVDFAQAIGCPNLVFGSPKNRVIQSADDCALARDFFYEAGTYAAAAGCFLALEPNPAAYGTNFINTTTEALDFVRACDARGLCINLDTGTILENQEDIEQLRPGISLVGHVHISEPFLKPLENRPLHAVLRTLLEETGYGNYVSIEMAATGGLIEIQRAAQMVKEVFA